MTTEQRLARRIVEFHDSLAAQGIGPRMIVASYVAIVVLSLRSVSERLRDELVTDMIGALDEGVPGWRQDRN